MKTWLNGGLALAIGIASCSNNVTITAETTGTTGTSSSSSSGTTNTQGSGGASTTGSSSTSTSGSTSSSSGTGGTGGTNGTGKLVTAETDMAQYQAINADLLSAQPALQGPFFVTDVFADNNATLFTVTGTDCSAPQTKVLFAPSGFTQFHGMRMPILSGQSLCHTTGAGGTLTILGFRPY